MKKLINDPANIVNELIDGFVYTNKNNIKKVIEPYLVVRNSVKKI